MQVILCVTFFITSHIRIHACLALVGALRAGHSLLPCPQLILLLTHLGPFGLLCGPLLALCAIARAVCHGDRLFGDPIGTSSCSLSLELWRLSLDAAPMICLLSLRRLRSACASLAARLPDERISQLPCLASSPAACAFMQAPPRCERRPHTWKMPRPSSLHDVHTW